MQTIKQLIKFFLPSFLLRKRREIINRAILNNWEKEGKPVPPPHIVKQLAIRECQQRYGYSTLIETGTFRGDMIDAQKTNFGKIISIELSKDLFDQAKKKYRKNHNITLIQGDSGDVLPEVLKQLEEPAVLWLDGHYSAGVTAKGDKACPIYEELDAIFNNRIYNHAILIDDARCFVGKDDYPTIEELGQYLKDKDPGYQMEIRDDIIHCEPQFDPKISGTK